MLRYIIILGFLISMQSLFAQTSFDELSKERAVLLDLYEVKPKKALLVKIDRLEGEILNEIKTNGYPIVVNTTMALDVQDQAYPLKGNTIATLEDQQEVLLLDKDAYGYYKIKVNDQIGYVYNLQMVPNLENYPLSLIQDDLEQQKIIDDLTKAPSVFRVRYECPSVVCGANTHAGEACKVQTRSCNGRCHLH
jgi:hypothetical protein